MKNEILSFLTQHSVILEELVKFNSFQEMNENEDILTTICNMTYEIDEEDTIESILGDEDHDMFLILKYIKLYFENFTKDEIGFITFSDMYEGGFSLNNGNSYKFIELFYDHNFQVDCLLLSNEKYELNEDED